MEKDFDRWNEIKIKLNFEGRKVFCNQREIWWCSVGVNVDVEIDGKNELFERPVVVLKVFNQSMIRIAPITSNHIDNRHYVSLEYNGETFSAMISQTKTISTKRLSRKITRLDDKQFERIVTRLKNNLV